MRDSGLATNITGILTLADTEYTITLPNNTHKFTLKARTTVILKIAFVAAESGTNYLTLPAAHVYWEDELRTNTKIYIQSPTAGAIVEIVAWSGGPDDL